MQRQSRLFEGGLDIVADEASHQVVRHQHERRTEHSQEVAELMNGSLALDVASRAEHGADGRCDDFSRREASGVLPARISTTTLSGTAKTSTARRFPAGLDDPDNGRVRGRGRS